MRLQDAHRELERRVEERTAALGRANQELRREISERQAAENERRRLEDELRHAQKMEAVGRLAGGIAHDFNNLLTAVQGYAELLLRSLGDSPLRPDVEEIYRAAERAAVLTRQLLAFSRRQILSPENLDLNGRVLEMSRMLGRLIGENISIDLRLSPEVWTVRADAAQLEQAIVNLGVNARDAMPGGGKLVIETANRELSKKAAERLGLKAGPFVTLLVRDSGVGIPPRTSGAAFSIRSSPPSRRGKAPASGSRWCTDSSHRAAAPSPSRASQAGARRSRCFCRAATVSRTAPRRRVRSPRHSAAPGRFSLSKTSGRSAGSPRPRWARPATTHSKRPTAWKRSSSSTSTATPSPWSSPTSSCRAWVASSSLNSCGSGGPDMPLLYMTGYAEEGDALRQRAPGALVLLKPFSPDKLLRTITGMLQRRES